MTGVRHPRFARLYVRMTEHESDEQVGQRRELLAGLRGRVVEIGAGNGRSFAFYPPQVEEVVAIEPEPTLREHAVQAARRAPIAVRVLDATAEALPLADASFDGAVSCLVLCSVADQREALSELRRVLVPGGELRFLEHVHAERQPLRALLAGAQRSTLWPRLAGGCHPARDTLRAIADAGFATSTCATSTSRTAGRCPRSRTSSARRGDSRQPCGVGARIVR